MMGANAPAQRLRAAAAHSTNSTARGAPRVLFAALCAALALLAVFPAPSNLLWQVRILVSELGIILAAASLLVFVRFRPTRAGRIAAALAGFAVVLALSPIVRGLFAARAAQVELARHFPHGALTQSSDVELAPVTYTYDSGMLLDYYMPAAAGSTVRPLVVVIHGGSWRGGDRTQMRGLNGYLARRGYAVAAIEYRLAPQHIFPAALEDVRGAIVWLKAHADTLRIDTTRIVLLGRSAGGQLALLGAYTLCDPAIRGVVSFYGPADLRWGWEHPSNPRVHDSRATLRDFMGGSLDERGELFDRASPLRYADAGVPTLLIHGRRDELVSYIHAERLAAALAARGTPHAYIRLPWATHACDYIPVGPCGRISTAAVEHFLTNVLP